MAEAESTTTHVPPESPPLRRHNSIAAPSAPKLSLPATPPQRTTSFELVSLKSPFSASYTSLRDVLPSPYAAVNSPTAASAYSCQEISIRNRLVKQAAWAYLQPMSASPGGASTPHFFRRLSAAFLGFFYHHFMPVVSRFFRRMLHALRVHVCRCYS